jgi:hypothetical protein
MFRTWCLDMFTIYPGTKLHMPSSNAPLGTAIKPENKKEKKKNPYDHSNLSVHYIKLHEHKLYVFRWPVTTHTVTLHSAVHIRIPYSVALVLLPPQNFEHPLCCCYKLVSIKSCVGVASGSIRPI